MARGGVGQAGVVAATAAAEQEDVVLAAVGVDAALVHALADVRQRVLVVADAHADVLGAERPDAKLDGVVVQRASRRGGAPRDRAR